MPRTSASNGIKPEIRALKVLILNTPVTSQEINDHVGTGNYASKYVSILNTYYDFEITTQKNGRNVVSYTVVREPKNIKELRSMTSNENKNKNVKIAVHKMTMNTKKKEKFVDETEKTFGTSGAIGSIDPDWDSMEGIDIRKIII